VFGLVVPIGNTVAVVCFGVAGQVVWRVALVTMVAAAAGGYLGARLTLRMRAAHIRAAICVLNFAIAAVFLWSKL